SNITLVRAIKFIGPTLTSIFGALEPLTAVAIGATDFGERFGWTSALGVGLVDAAVSIVVLDTQRKTGKTTPSSST
ncbi:DMT family transporter, partial [Alistipes putredinis]